VNLSLDDMENVLPPPEADVGEASGDELDIAPRWNSDRLGSSMLGPEDK